MTVTAILAGLGLILMSRLGAAWQIYLFLRHPVRHGIEFCGRHKPSARQPGGLLRRRGMMTGIVKVGSGGGQVLIPSLQVCS